MLKLTSVSSQTYDQTRLQEHILQGSVKPGEDPASSHGNRARASFAKCKCLADKPQVHKTTLVQRRFRRREFSVLASLPPWGSLFSSTPSQAVRLPFRILGLEWLIFLCALNLVMPDQCCLTLCLDNNLYLSKTVVHAPMKLF